MYNGQMEFSLENGNGRIQHRRRQGRAQWWFQKMRQVVDRARGYPLPTPPPEQMLFPGSHREALASGFGSAGLGLGRRTREERQVVE